jgi:hypothetical protein
MGHPNLWVVLVFVGGVGVAVGFGSGQFFEEVGVLDGGRDLVVSGGPLAEVEDATAVGAEGEVLVGGEDYFSAGGAEEGFWGGTHGMVDSRRERLFVPVPLLWKRRERSSQVIKLRINCVVCAKSCLYRCSDGDIPERSVIF